MKVRVDISCWQGYGLGASHYYVKITEGDWGEQGGRVFRSKFETYKEARDYSAGIIDEHFPGCEVESTGETRFVYGRSGD